MAESIIHPELGFTASTKTYAIHPEATMNDLEDQLNMRQGHLEAMLYIGSNSHEGFSDSEEVESFLWACRTMAQEIRALTDEIIIRMKEQQVQTEQ